MIDISPLSVCGDKAVHLVPEFCRRVRGIPTPLECNRVLHTEVPYLHADAPTSRLFCLVVVCVLCSTSAHLAARMVYTAEFEFGDIEGRNVLDLGCGTGMLGIAAGVLGAGSVVGLDIDPGALRAAAENADSMDVDMDLVCCDVARNPCVPGSFQYTILIEGVSVVSYVRGLTAALEISWTCITEESCCCTLQSIDACFFLREHVG